MAHLLDTCLRRLSFDRDRLQSGPRRTFADYADLVGYLNQLNAEWVGTMRRVSPRVLMDLLDLAEPQLHAYFASLDPEAPATIGVAWAGEERSLNWFDLGREYTERWLHQQQIREAVGAPALSQRRWLHPTLDIFVRALPFTYGPVEAPPGTAVRARDHRRCRRRLDTGARREQVGAVHRLSPLAGRSCDHGSGSCLEALLQGPSPGAGPP